MRGAGINEEESGMEDLAGILLSVLGLWWLEWNFVKRIDLDEVRLAGKEMDDQ